MRAGRSECRSRGAHRLLRPPALLVLLVGAALMMLWHSSVQAVHALPARKDRDARGAGPEPHGLPDAGDASPLRVPRKLAAADRGGPEDDGGHIHLQQLSAAQHAALPQPQQQQQQQPEQSDAFFWLDGKEQGHGSAGKGLSARPSPALGGGDAVELFALAPNRSAALERIGSPVLRNFFAALLAQSGGSVSAARAAVEEAVRGSSHLGSGTPLDQSDWRGELLDRQAMLEWEADPGRAAEHLVKRLGIDLDAEPPPSAAGRGDDLLEKSSGGDLSDGHVHTVQLGKLRDGLLDGTERRLHESHERASSRAGRWCSETWGKANRRCLRAAVLRELRAGHAHSHDALAAHQLLHARGAAALATDGSSVLRDGVLALLDRADHPGLLDLLVADLTRGDGTEPSPFGWAAVHAQLTAPQLKELAARVPGLSRSAVYAAALLAQSAPAPSSTPPAAAEHAQAADDFAAALAAAAADVPEEQRLRAEAAGLCRRVAADALARSYRGPLFERLLELARQLRTPFAGNQDLYSDGLCADHLERHRPERRSKHQRYQQQQQQQQVGVELVGAEERGAREEDAVPYLSDAFGRDALPSGLLRRVALSGAREALSSAAGGHPLHPLQWLLQQLFAGIADAAGAERAVRGAVDWGYAARLFGEEKIRGGAADPSAWFDFLREQREQQRSGGRKGWAPAGDPVAEMGRPELRFLSALPPYWGGGDAVTLTVEASNLQTAEIRVFDIDTAAHARDTGSEVDQSVDVAGLAPTWRGRVNLTARPLVRLRRQIKLPQLDRPGVFVVDAVGSGVAARAVVRKGQLHAVDRVGASGHVFHLLAEDGAELRNGSVWLGGREFRDGGDGAIRVPFLPYTAAGSSPSELHTAVLSHPSGRARVIQFPQQRERYELSAHFMLSRETLVGGSEAVVLVRPTLLLAGVAVPLALAEGARVTVETIAMPTGAAEHGEPEAPAVRELPLELSEEHEARVSFLVPPRLHTLRCRLTVSVRPTQGRTVQLSAAQSWDVNGRAATLDLQDLFLTRAAPGGGWALEARGPAGEPRPNLPVRIAAGTQWQELGVFHTDAAGQISVPDLPSSAVVSVRYPSASEWGDHPEGGASRPRRRRWQWGDAELRHSSGTAVRGEPFGVALRAPPPAALSPEHFALRRVAPRSGSLWARELSDHYSALSLSGWSLGVDTAELQPGSYRLHIDYPGHRALIELEVVSSPTAVGGWLVAAGAAREAAAGSPLRITAAEAAGEELVIRLTGGGSSPRVHLFASNFYHGQMEPPTVEPPAPRPPRRLGPAVSSVSGARAVGDEERYISDRAQCPTRVGTALPRPGVLVSPWATSQTADTSAQAASPESSFSAREHGAASFAGHARPPPELHQDQGGDLWSSALDFLAGGSAVIPNLRPGADGELRVPLARLGAARLVTVIAVDAEGGGAAAEVATGAAAAPALRPGFALTEAAALPAGKHYVQVRETTPLLPGEAPQLSDGAAVELYRSIPQLFSLMHSLCDDRERLDSLRFVVEWGRLSAEERAQRYAAHASHELDFYLSRKHPGFFREVVVPQLRHKLQPSVVDDALLNRSLEHLADPAAVLTLNYFERALASRALGSKGGPLRRSLRNLAAASGEELRGRTDRAFAAALGGADAGAGGGEPGAPAAAPELFMGNMARPPAAAMMVGDGGRRLSFEMAMQKESAVAEDMEEAAVMDEGEDSGGLSGALPTSGSRPLPQGRPRVGLMRSAAPPDKARKRKAMRDGDLRARGSLRIQWAGAGKTEEWAESRYYRRRRNEEEPLTPSAHFWSDWAAHTSGPFLSPRVATAVGSAAEVILALAVTDLPLEAPGGRTQQRPEEWGPALVFHEGIRSVQQAPAAQPLLVGTHYQDAVSGESVAPKELLSGAAYRCTAVLSNPTPTERRVELLMQVPVGAVPLRPRRATTSRSLVLPPHGTVSASQSFYFPQPAQGDVQHYPAQVAEDGNVSAAAEAHTLRVSPRGAEARRRPQSWAWVAARGSTADLVGFLSRDDGACSRHDLGEVAWRMRDPAAYRAVVGELSAQGCYVPSLWHYAFQHRDTERAAQVLRARGRRVPRRAPLWLGDTAASPELLEYSPLVHARAHPLAGRAPGEMTPQLLSLWQRFLAELIYRPVTPKDRLVAAAMLLALGRTDEAVTAVAELPDLADHDPGAIQLAYLRSYSALTRGDAQGAGDAARRGMQIAAHPRWRALFQGVLDEIASAASPGTAAAGSAAKTEPYLSLVPTDAPGEVTIRASAGIGPVRVGVHEIDIEMLFSRRPFEVSSARQGGLAHVRPAHTALAAVPEAGGELRWKVPSAYTGREVIVEAVASAGLRAALPVSGGSVACDTVPDQGLLVARLRGSGRPVAGAYVKVYSRASGGSVQFYKDGYTDLAGRFDYMTVSAEVEYPSRLAILVASRDHGAAVAEVAPPPRP